MYDDEEDQQNSERSDHPDEIGSDSSMLVFWPQRVHSGWGAVVVPRQDQSLSLEFFGVPPTIARRIKQFFGVCLVRSIRFRPLSHIHKLTLPLSPPINFLSMRNVSCLDLTTLDVAFDSGFLYNLPCLAELKLTRLDLASCHGNLLAKLRYLTFVAVSTVARMLCINCLSHIYPSHIHPMKPYFPSLTHVNCTHDIKACFLSHDDICVPLFDDDYGIGDLSENVGNPTTETLEGSTESIWREYQCANPALEQQMTILPHTLPHVMTRTNAVSLQRLQCLTGSIAQENLAELVTMEGCFLEEERSIEIINSSIELPCSDPALKLPTVTPAQGSVEEERYVKIINPSMELYSRSQCIEIPQLAGPALQPEAFPNVGKIMQLDSSEQESFVRFDATNIGGNVVSANKNCTTTCSKKKITITDLLPLIGLTRKVAAEKIGVSIPTFKRYCRQNNIIQWPHYKNKDQCSSLKQKLATDSDQGAAGAFVHFVTGTHSGAVGSNHHNSPCSKPPKRRRGKKTSPSCKTPSTVATCSDPAPMQAMFTFPQIMPHLRAGQDARIEILKTTEDIPIQSVQGVATRSCSSPQKQAGSDVPCTSSPKHLHCLETMNGCFLEEERSIESVALPCIQMPQSATFSLNPTTSSHANVVGSNYQNAQCSKPSKSRREKKMSPSCKKPSIGGQTEIADQMLESSHSAPNGQLQEQNRFHLQKQNAGTAIIKAKYGKQTVIVPPRATSGIVKLREELARRLELEHGSFDVEYEDEDHDWILIACDDALQECLTSSTSRDNQVIRLSVRDKVVNSQNSGKALEC